MTRREVTFRKGPWAPSQLTHEAEYRGEQEERRRVMRLIDNKMLEFARASMAERRLLEEASEEELAEASLDEDLIERRREQYDFAIRHFESLRRAVQQGYQR